MEESKARAWGEALRIRSENGGRRRRLAVRRLSSLAVGISGDAVAPRVEYVEEH
ncbi:hypothetical protein Acr_24g0009440 [Actinidia rufa]|uniref:Uncharacterized protein n=1 Tax=Actinidia rufa TaxID=165716 RepID=A0A7J0GW60_9ERIC|nr:hypothetical protein Acr_24g0009440 [Actinidia rufa]